MSKIKIKKENNCWLVGVRLVGGRSKKLFPPFILQSYFKTASNNLDQSLDVIILNEWRLPSAFQIS